MKTIILSARAGVAFFLLHFLVSFALPVECLAQGGCTYAFEEDGKWGFCYRGKWFVFPQYEAVASVPCLSHAFLAKKGGKWGLVDAYNQVLIPFEYDDVNVSDHEDTDHINGIHIDSISAYGKGTILKGYDYNINNHYSASFNNTHTPFPILTVCKNGKWGAIDLQGNEVAGFKYDMAYAFRIWCKGKKEAFFAYVKIGGKWGLIDIGGKEVIPCKSSNPPKYNKIATLIRNDAKKMASRRQQLRSIVPSRPTFRHYNPTYAGGVVVEKTTSVEAKTTKRNSKKRTKRTKTVPKKQTVTYRILAEDGSPIVNQEFAKVFERENDAVRVMGKDGKMGVVNLNTGMLYPCIYDSIGLFDEYGFAKANRDGRSYTLGINHCADTYGGLELLDEICKDSYSVWKNDGIELAMPKYDAFAELLGENRSGGVRYAYTHYLRDFYEAHRDEYDPEIRARREAARRAAESQQKSGSSFWSILGGIAAVAGGITSVVSGGSSETGDALVSLGETLTGIDSPTESTNSGVSTVGITSKGGSQDVSSMQSRIDRIDKRIEEIGQEQVALMKERDDSKSKMMSVSKTTVKPISQSNVSRNATPSRIRQRAKTVAKAQTPYRNQLSNIHTRMQKLNDEKSTLLAERKDLAQKINDAQGNASEIEVASETQRTDDSGKTYDLKKSTYAKNNIRSYQHSMDVLLGELSDRKARQDFYLNGGETMSDFRKRVRSLQKKAKDLIEEWKQKTGYASFPTDHSLVYDWNP